MRLLDLFWALEEINKGLLLLNIVFLLAVAELSTHLMMLFTLSSVVLLEVKFSEENNERVAMKEVKS